MTLYCKPLGRVFTPSFFILREEGISFLLVLLRLGLHLLLLFCLEVFLHVHDRRLDLLLGQKRLASGQRILHTFQVEVGIDIDFKFFHVAAHIRAKRVTELVFLGLQFGFFIAIHRGHREYHTQDDHYACIHTFSFSP
jgi:hypothetical protein